MGNCPDKRMREVLRLTESFVLRRHVCRERANETDRNALENYLLHDMRARYAQRAHYRNFTDSLVD